MALLASTSECVRFGCEVQEAPYAIVCCQGIMDNTDSLVVQPVVSKKAAAAAAAAAAMVPSTVATAAARRPRKAPRTKLVHPYKLQLFHFHHAFPRKHKNAKDDGSEEEDEEDVRRLTRLRLELRLPNIPPISVTLKPRYTKQQQQQQPATLHMSRIVSVAEMRRALGEIYFQYNKAHEGKDMFTPAMPAVSTMQAVPAMSTSTLHIFAKQNKKGRFIEQASIRVSLNLLKYHTSLTIAKIKQKRADKRKHKAEPTVCKNKKPKTMPMPTAVPMAAAAPAAMPAPAAATCVVCTDAPCDHLVLPCCHLCLCAGCSTSLQQTQAHFPCPICRTACETVKRIFVS